MRWGAAVRDAIDRLTGMVGYRKPVEEIERKEAESQRSFDRFDSEVQRIDATVDRLQSVGRILE